MKSYVSVPRYVQGPKELIHIAEYVSQFGSNAALIATKSGYARFKDILEISFSDAQNITYDVLYFQGEATHAYIDEIMTTFPYSNFDVVVGLGGGKVIDTAKEVAHVAGLPQESIHCLPFAVAEDNVYHALLQADKIGKAHAL